MIISTQANYEFDVSKYTEQLSFFVPDDPETGKGTDIIELPKKNTYFLKTPPKGRLFLKSFTALPPSFFINRMQVMLNKETSQAVIEQDDIEILKNYFKKRTSSDQFADINLSREEKEFCNRNGIRQYIPVASELIKRHFSNIQRIDSEILHDPDTEEQWLVINVQVKGEIEDILNMYDKYTGEWVSSVPWPEREKICLSYIII